MRVSRIGDQSSLKIKGPGPKNVADREFRFVTFNYAAPDRETIVKLRNMELQFMVDVTCFVR